MTRETLARVLEQRVPAEIRDLHRPPRADVMVPWIEALAGEIRGKRILELGSGETLLLAHPLAERGAQVTAIDPALADSRVDARNVQCIAEDVFAAASPRVPPADVTVSTLFFGAPLRQRARRELWPRYRAGDRPSEGEVHAKLRDVECGLIDRLAAWTRPGGWTVHFSLEGLFAATPEDWKTRGFDPLGWPEPAATDVLGRTLIAQLVR